MSCCLRWRSSNWIWQYWAVISGLILLSTVMVEAIWVKNLSKLEFSYGWETSLPTIVGVRKLEAFNFCMVSECVYDRQVLTFYHKAQVWQTDVTLIANTAVYIALHNNYIIKNWCTANYTILLCYMYVWTFVAV